MSLFKNTASQKVRVFAFDATLGTPKTGDAANISAYLSKDFGAVTQLTDTSATEDDATNAKGYYLFDISQSETNADDIGITGKSSTSNIVVVGAPARIATRPPNAGALSIDSNGRVDAIKLAGQTITAAAGVTFPSSVASPTNITAGTITTVTTLTNLPAITAGWLTATGIAGDAITAAKIADGAIDTATFAGGTTIPRCTLVDTTTTNTDMRGTNNAALAATALSTAVWTAPPTGFLTASFPSDPADQSLVIAATDAILTAVNTKASQTSVDDLPTNAELATALSAADDAVLAAISALSVPTAAANAAAVWAAAARTLTAFSFTPSVDVTKVNGVTLTGDGSATPWGPA